MVGGGDRGLGQGAVGVELSEFFHQRLRLLDLIEGSGSVRTAEAARELGVTEETVLRDFEKLEAEGALQRSHGGAVKHAAAQEHSTSARASQSIAEKRQIAAVAVARIRPGQTILFDASTTALEVAQLLPDQPLHELRGASEVSEDQARMKIPSTS